MRLFHFSETSQIDRFEPRPVLVPSPRPSGMEWLNGPLVWAIDDWHQPLYLFPRDCPRILIWPGERTTAEDRERWWGDRDFRMIAYVEEGWLERLSAATLFRYELPETPFEPLEDAGMFVSRSAVRPLSCKRIGDLPGALAEYDVDLRPLATLKPLKPVWDSSIHASGIRLRNARDWS